MVITNPITPTISGVTNDPNRPQGFVGPIMPQTVKVVQPAPVKTPIKVVQPTTGTITKVGQAQPTQEIRPANTPSPIFSMYKALTAGANPTAVLQEIYNQNKISKPSLAQSIRTAIEGGADHSLILDEIFKQNGFKPLAERTQTLAELDTPTEKPGIFTQIKNDIFSGKYDQGNVAGFLTPAKDAAIGFGKSLAKTGQTILKPVDKVLSALGVEGATAPGRELSDEALKPKGFFQGVGNTVGSAAQTGAVLNSVAPVTAAITKSAQAIKAPQIVKTLADITGRSAFDAATGYGLTKLQGGSNDSANTVAIISGALPWAGAAFTYGAKPLLTQVGEKIQYALIKPTKTDLVNGFKVENVNKYNLGGSLEQTAQKTQAAITERAAKLQSMLKPGSASVDLTETYVNTANAVKKLKFENAGANTAIQRELDKLAQELDVLSKNGTIDIAQAQLVKRAFGSKGAWEWNVPREDANAVEAVYTTAYNFLKTQIEKSAASAGQPGVRAINKELSELIPIEQALIRRLPVAARQNPISLTDLVSLIGGSKLGVPLFILNRLTKSGKAGAALAKTPAEIRGGVGTAVFGAGSKQVSNAPRLSELNVPKVNVGLSIENVSALKAEELGRKINQLNAQWVKNPTAANKKALDNAKALYRTLVGS